MSVGAAARPAAPRRPKPAPARVLPAGGNSSVAAGNKIRSASPFGLIQRTDTELQPTTVLVLGAFDLFHRGHVEFLKTARSLGDRLVVGVNSDAKVARYKRVPVIAAADRLAIVAAVRYVDHAEITDAFSVDALIRRHRVGIVAHGDDWTVERYLDQIRLTAAQLDALGARLELVPYYRGVSTSKIIAELGAVA